MVYESKYYKSCMGETRNIKIDTIIAMDETASVLKTFIIGLENLLSLKVKIIRCDNGTEFKNADLNQFCGLKGIKREFSVPRTPQQNGIAERKNRTLIEAGFQDTEKAGEEETQTYVLFPVLSDGLTNPKNNKDAYTDGKEHDDIQKSMSPDIHSSSCGDQTREQGDKAENKDKGKSPVVTITGFKYLNEEFAECINNSSNRVNAAGSSVFAAGLNFTNSTNDFSAAEEPKRVHQALKDPSWIKAMQEELLQFKMQKVWILVDLPYGKRAIGTKWVYRNKKDERGIVIRNKVRLVA
nr:ribonuclease H-like domain-containing protein [Tanacetum cinerariifolium]